MARLTAADIEALAPVFGFGNDVAFCAFIYEQQAKADARAGLDNAPVPVSYGTVCEREDLGEYGR